MPKPERRTSASPLFSMPKLVISTADQGNPGELAGFSQDWWFSASCGLRRQTSLQRGIALNVSALTEKRGNCAEPSS